MTGPKRGRVTGDPGASLFGTRVSDTLWTCKYFSLRNEAGLDSDSRIYEMDFL